MQGEIEAGLVFSAAAIEHEQGDPGNAETCRAEAEDCFRTALALIRQFGLMPDRIRELQPTLNMLEERLNGLGHTRPKSAAA